MSVEEKAINLLQSADIDEATGEVRWHTWYKGIDKDIKKAFDVAIKALEQEPRKGEWLRMSDLSEEEDNRYQCSRCRNVVHYKDKMNLYTFNSWCGRCGSDNGRKIEVEL